MLTGTNSYTGNTIINAGTMAVDGSIANTTSVTVNSGGRLSGMGTGGTLSGVGKFLKEKKPSVQIVGVDPVGSVYYDFVKTGQVTKPFTYKVEGIGEDFVPSTMNLSSLDEVVRVDDRECFFMTRDVVRLEGIYCGGSAGAAGSTTRGAVVRGRWMRVGGSARSSVMIAGAGPGNAAGTVLVIALASASRRSISFRSASRRSTSRRSASRRSKSRRSASIASMCLAWRSTERSSRLRLRNPEYQG